MPPPHSDTVEFYQRLSTETLFFIFYYLEVQQGPPSGCRNEVGAATTAPLLPQPIPAPAPAGGSGLPRSGLACPGQQQGACLPWRPWALSQASLGTTTELSPL